VLYAGDVDPSTKAIRTASARIDHSPKSIDEMVDTLTAACRQHPCKKRETRSLLLVGFDGSVPHLVAIEDNARTKTPTVMAWGGLGYHAIGTGWYIASNLLGMYQHTRFRSVAETVYTCCAAKFFSEAATDVGEDTEVYVLYKGGVDLRPMSLVPTIRKAWRSSGQLPKPKAIVSRIAEYLAPLTQSR
jgi:hypothetical protein